MNRKLAKLKMQSHANLGGQTSHTWPKDSAQGLLPSFLTTFDLWQHKQTLCKWSAVKRLLKCKTLDASPAGCKSLAAFRPTDSLRGSRRATRSTPDALPSCQINCKQIERVLVDFQNCIAYALTSHITGCVSAAIAC